jgi:hypothetical protein
MCLKCACPSFLTFAWKLICAESGFQDTKNIHLYMTLYSADYLKYHFQHFKHQNMFLVAEQLLLDFLCLIYSKFIEYIVIYKNINSSKPKDSVSGNKNWNCKAYFSFPFLCTYSNHSMVDFQV